MDRIAVSEQIFDVIVDYSLSFSQMARLSGCFLGKRINEGFFPIIGNGRKHFSLRLQDFYSRRSLSEMIGKQEYQFAQIEHAFYFAAAYADVQSLYSIVFPGSFSVDHHNKIVCPLLTSMVGGKNIVSYEADNHFGVFNKVMLLV